MISLEWYSHSFDFPSKQEPTWKEKIERWYQLDAAAYGMVEAAVQMGLKMAVSDTVIAASPGASNVADYDFVDSGAMSASKFVHTLPNIRVSPFCQVMDWSGTVLCVQRDPNTLAAGLLEGALMLSPEHPTVWIFGIFPGCRYTAHGLKLSFGKNGPLKVILKPGPANDLANDQQLTDWFSEGTAEKIQLAENVMVSRGV